MDVTLTPDLERALVQRARLQSNPLNGRRFWNRVMNGKSGFCGSVRLAEYR
jgi:hypothetical protein